MQAGAFIKNISKTKSFAYFIELFYLSRSRWQPGLRHGATAIRFLGFRVRILPGAWIFVSCECYMLSSTGLCEGLMTRPEVPYSVWVVCA